MLNGCVSPFCWTLCALFHVFPPWSHARGFPLAFYWCCWSDHSFTHWSIFNSRMAHADLGTKTLHSLCSLGYTSALEQRDRPFPGQDWKQQTGLVAIGFGSQLLESPQLWDFWTDALFVIIWWQSALLFGLPLSRPPQYPSQFDVNKAHAPPFSRLFLEKHILRFRLVCLYRLYTDHLCPVPHCPSPFRRKMSWPFPSIEGIFRPLKDIRASNLPGVKVIEVILEPGDTIFVPAMWPHEVWHF